MRIPWIDLEDSVENSRVTISPDGTRLAATGGLWDLRSGIRLAKLSPAYLSVHFSNDSRVLLSGNRLFDASSGERIREIPHLAQLTDQGPVSITNVGDSALVVRFDDGRTSTEIPFDTGSAPSGLIAPDGSSLLTASADGRVASLDLRGEPRWERVFDRLPDDWYENHFELELLCAGRVLRLSSEGGERQRFLESETGALLGDFLAPEELGLDSWHGNWLALAHDRGLAYFVEEARAVVSTLGGSDSRELRNPGGIRPPLAFSERLLAVATRREISFHDRESLDIVGAVACAYARELRFSEDERLLAATMVDRIRVWRL